MNFYKLNENREPVPATDAEIDEVFDIEKRRVARTELSSGLDVSTVFLGLEYPGGMFFETITFNAEGNGLDKGFRRYRTWAEAESGHAEIVKTLEPSSSG